MSYVNWKAALRLPMLGSTRAVASTWHVLPGGCARMPGRLQRATASVEAAYLPYKRMSQYRMCMQDRSMCRRVCHMW
jgi:hypothetical protein